MPVIGSNDAVETLYMLGRTLYGQQWKLGDNGTIQPKIKNTSIIVHAKNEWCNVKVKHGHTGQRQSSVRTLLVKIKDHALDHGVNVWIEWTD